MIDPTHIHPMVVHFPIALLLVGFLAELLHLFFRKEVCLSKAGLWLMILGTLGAGAAWLSAQLFINEPTDGSITEIFERHETLALVTLLIMAAGTLLRLALIWFKIDKPAYRWVVFTLYALGAVCVGITGHWGGTMVMDYMMGL